jgi:UDP-N-acetylglucosamine 1-carboxyvinyltransferase
LDTHLWALRPGRDCTINEEGEIHIKTRGGSLIGSDVFLVEASVTATENVLMALPCPGGEHHQQCCKRAHVQDLVFVLQNMGCSSTVWFEPFRIKGQKR